MENFAKNFVLRTIPFTYFTVTKSIELVDTAQGERVKGEEPNSETYFVKFKCEELRIPVTFNLAGLKRHLVVTEWDNGDLCVCDEIIINADSTVSLMTHEIIVADEHYSKFIKSDVRMLDYQATEKIEAAASYLLNRSSSIKGNSFDCDEYQFARSAALVMDAVRNGNRVADVAFTY